MYQHVKPIPRSPKPEGAQAHFKGLWIKIANGKVWKHNLVEWKLSTHEIESVRKMIDDQNVV